MALPGREQRAGSAEAVFGGPREMGLARDGPMGWAQGKGASRFAAIVRPTGGHAGVRTIPVAAEPAAQKPRKQSEFMEIAREC